MEFERAVPVEEPLFPETIRVILWSPINAVFETITGIEKLEKPPGRASWIETELEEIPLAFEVTV